MGQKVHPLGLRIGITQKTRSNWFAKANDYPRLVLEDQLLRCYIYNAYTTANIVNIYISRSKTTKNLQTQKIIDLVEISIYTANPEKLVNKENPQSTIRDLKIKLENLCQKNRSKYNLPEIRIILNILKVKNSHSEASVLANFLIEQLEQRVPFRSALKKTLNQTRMGKFFEPSPSSQRQGVQNQELKGIKIQISGRLNGAEIARTEWIRKGRVPLQTLRADIDYSYKTAKTIYGILGIKIWTFKGEKTK